MMIVGLRCGGKAAVRGAGAARNEPGQAVLGHQMLACHVDRGAKLPGPHKLLYGGFLHAQHLGQAVGGVEGNGVTSFCKFILVNLLEVRSMGLVGA